MQMLWRDVALAWRRLLASPAFTFFSVITLAMGIAAVAGARVLVDAVAAPPPGVADVGRLVTLSHTAFGGPTAVTFSSSDFEEVRRRQKTMSEVAAFTATPQVLASDGWSHPGLAEVVSGNYFSLLGVNPAAGRLIQRLDDQPGATPVTVLSHDVWQRVFAGRPDVVGRTVMLGGHPFEVVGVAPADFVGLMRNGRFPVMAWVSLSSASVFERLGIDARLAQNERWLQLRARPSPGATIDQISAELRAIGLQLDRESPIGTDLLDPRRRTPPNVSRMWVARWTGDLLMDEGTSYVGPSVVALLMTAAGLVLLVTCSNLANLIVARGSVRRHELALRLALGATRWRLIFGCMAEVLIITAMAGAVAIGLTQIIVFMLDGPFVERRGIAFILRPELGLEAIGLGLLAAAVALLVGGVVPAMVLTGRGTLAELVSGVAPTIIPRWRLRRVLIGGQVAVSAVLLGTAALLLGHVLARGRLDVRVDLDRLAMVEVDLALQNYDEERSLLLIDRVIGRVAAVAAIQDVAASSGFPFGPVPPTASVLIGDRSLQTQGIAVTPGFFRTAGATVVRGVEFGTAAAAPGDLRPVIIDTALAEAAFQSLDVVGRPIEVRLPGAAGRDPVTQTRTIVGVVSAIGDRGGVPPRVHALYLPLDTRPLAPVTFTARTSGDAERVADEIRRVIASIDPHLGVSLAGSARRVTARSIETEALAAGLATMLGGIGLAVVLAGLYGMLSYLVSRRTREIGMRLALGATPRQVLLLVIREGLSPVVVGLAIGGVTLLVLRQPVVAGAFGFADVTDVALLVGVAILMLFATTIACYLPARRAARVDPASALKHH